MAAKKLTDFDPAAALSDSDEFGFVQGDVNVHEQLSVISDFITAKTLGNADTAELIRDTIANALVAGDNITITVNDAGDEITIDAAGGGGGATASTIYCSPSGSNNGASTQLYATMGNVIIPRIDFSIDKLYGVWRNAAVGDQHTMFIAELDQSDHSITSTLAAATDIYIAGTTEPYVAYAHHEFDLAAPVTLTAGHSYLIGLVLLGQTTTSPCRAIGPSTGGAYPNAPIDQGAMFALYQQSARYTGYASNVAEPAGVAPSVLAGLGYLVLSFRAQVPIA